MEESVIQSLISDLALILILGAVATIVFKTLKQPVVLGYIVAGFIASPHFALFPSVADEANIEFWAQIGIIVLLFTLGLEFSFKKLLNVGGSAIVTAAIIVAGMMGLGFLVGKSVLGYGLVNSMFLGGMLSMSSTTIILKALTDLNMRQRRFVPMIMAVLIVEDLFAVLLMVILSSVAVNNSVEGGQLIDSILKLGFFLVVWFTVGIFVIPSIFKRFHRVITDEMMLIISMGLCFFMAVFSVRMGFSLALGAFVMGSILAGTVEVKRIERVVSSIKDLFGAVFFISVGMMVDPSVIVQHAGTIALLAGVVIVGMILFGTCGMLASGQPLRNAVQSGFALTQIGEFSFIIASMGTSMGVLESSTYPIIVAVSVITTFTTPFFIKGGDGAYRLLERILPQRWVAALNSYSKTATSDKEPTSREIWRNAAKRHILRLVLYSVVVIALYVLSAAYLLPVLERTVAEPWDRLWWLLVSLAPVVPLLYGLLTLPLKRSDRAHLTELKGRVSYVPLVIMEILSLIVCFFFLLVIIHEVYNGIMVLIGALAVMAVAILVLAPHLRRSVAKIEARFLDNVNVQENHRTGHGNNMVSDLHLAYMQVGHGCRFAGDTLQRADLRRKYGINVANIERNGVLHPVPNGSMRIFPGDTLGVIGTEEQIEQLLPLVESEGEGTTSTVEAKFVHYTLTGRSPLIGLKLKDARLREDYATLLVSVQREESYLAPTPDIVFLEGDTLWLVGDPATIKKLI